VGLDTVGKTSQRFDLSYSFLSSGVERVLDPSLCGKPIGITQKSLLATTSYEARARGVKKLMNIQKAKELVPDLILVDGEDLTQYRRFSRRVERLVGAVVGVDTGGERAVEKLGMDEVS
jgi:DNA polymerase iota